MAINIQLIRLRANVKYILLATKEEGSQYIMISNNDEYIGLGFEVRAQEVRIVV